MFDVKTKVLLADDHTILRAGLRRILEAEPDMEVIGESANGEEAISQSHDLKPDLVIMDISGQDGLRTLRDITNGEGPRVLVLSDRVEHQLIAESVSAGASGYLAKDSMDSELISSIRTIMHGGTVFSASVSRILADTAHLDSLPAPRSVESLTSREREVFLLLAEGKTPTEVANALIVSPKTVHTHRQHIMEKLALRTTTELIRFALREGLIKTV